MSELPADKSQQPLTGYRVLDLSGPLGVYCGKLLADAGADVIKVEPPAGDDMRGTGPFIHGRPGPEESLYWRHFNTNKRGITLNIGSAPGAGLFKRLAAKADILLETYPPGYLDSLGLGYEGLSEDNPGMVYASLTPFGQTGPYKDFKASDLIGFAMGGYMYVTGWPHTPPTRLWGSQAYHTASNRAFIAILMALYDRLSTGLGQRVDVSMQEAVAATTEHVNTAYNYEETPAVRCGFRHGGQFVATWRCKDGYVSITTNTQQAWNDLRAWMDRDGMAGDLMEEKYNERFVLRGELSHHIEGLIGDWAMLHTRQEITDWGQTRHHPWGPVATPEELLANPQLWARGFFTELEHRETEHGQQRVSLVYPGAPYKLSTSPWELKRAAPGVGEHNLEVYCGELGLAAADLEELARGGAV